MNEKDRNLRNIQLFIKNAPVAIAMFDRSMCYLAASNRWMVDYHLRYDDIIGRSHYDIFPEIPDQWKVAHQSGLGGNVVRNQDDCFEREDGTLLWLHWGLQPWNEPDGSVGGIIVFTEDMTEQKQALDMLQKSEEKYRGLFESMNEGFVLQEIITDKNGRPCDFRFLEMNPACERLTGLSRAEMIGHCVTEFVPESSWIARYGNVGLTGKPERLPGARELLQEMTMYQWLEALEAEVTGQ